MRHSIIGERDEIDKERPEIGNARPLEWGCRAQKICSGTASCDECATRGSALFRKQVLSDCAE